MVILARKWYHCILTHLEKRTPDIDCSTTRKRQANQESNEQSRDFMLIMNTIIQYCEELLFCSRVKARRVDICVFIYCELQL